jgi:hypothetical protein
MMRGRAGRIWTSRAWLLSGALVVLGFVSPHALAAQAQNTPPNEQSHYANARPLLDFPLPEIIAAIPQLQGLEPAANQDDLESILDKTGAVIQDMSDRMPSLISHEDVTQTKENIKGKVTGQNHLAFDYLILVHQKNGTDSIEEYRPGERDNPAVEQSLKQGFGLSSGFVSAWLHFLPANLPEGRFRYLGRQTLSGVRCYVMAFAQIPGNAIITGKFTYGEKTAVILDQGIGWFDEASFRVVRLQTDLLAPRPDLGLEKLTTELQFADSRLPQSDTASWLPREVVVTARINAHVYRNVHRYSDYRLFKVESKILAPPPN